MDWFRHKARESIAFMDVEVNEEILEQGLATAPNPWQPDDDVRLCSEIGIPSRSAPPPMSVCLTPWRNARALPRR